MEDFKNKLYNYEADPPEDMWKKISTELNSNTGKVVEMRGLKRRPKIIFYGITAAASLIIIFLISVIFNKSEKHQFENTSASLTQTQQQLLISKKIQDSLELNNQILENIINSKKDKNFIAEIYENSINKIKKYITIEGPEGQPVKISPKVATLIESADNEFPPKPVWNKKIEKWKQIMLSSTLSPTSTNLLDIVQISSSNDNNE